MTVNRGGDRVDPVEVSNSSRTYVDEEIGASISLTSTIETFPIRSHVPPPEVAADQPEVTFSGQGSEGRCDYVAAAKAKGWRVVGAPRATTTVLVFGEDHSKSKVTKAEKLGITVVSYGEWEKLLAGGDAPR